jgi:hypothetical protein
MNEFTFGWPIFILFYSALPISLPSLSSQLILARSPVIDGALEFRGHADPTRKLTRSDSLTSLPVHCYLMVTYFQHCTEMLITCSTICISSLSVYCFGAIHLIVLDFE